MIKAFNKSTISYVVLTGLTILLITSIKTHQLSIATMLAIFFLMVVKYICLIMVQSKNKQMNFEIKSFLTLFTWILYIPIFLTAAENLVQPTLIYFIRFCAIVELSFVLLSVCVIFTVKYQFKKSKESLTNQKEIMS